MLRLTLQFLGRLPGRGLAVLALAVALAACNVATPVVTNPPPPVATTAPAVTDTISPTDTAAPTVAASPTAEAPTSAPEATGGPVATTLDPCALLPSAEASALAGVTFGSGKPETLPNGPKTCVYTSQGTNILFVEVIQAPDEATAQAYKTQFLDDLKSQVPELANAGIQATEVPNFADGAVAGQLSENVGPLTANASMFGFLKGTVFFGFSDLALGGTAPDRAAMHAQANTVLGRIP